MQGEAAAGINVRRGAVSDMREEGVLQPLLVTQSSINLATECVRMILKAGPGSSCRINDFSKPVY